MTGTFIYEQGECGAPTVDVDHGLKLGGGQTDERSGRTEFELENVDAREWRRTSTWVQDLFL
jgi:hypothetical protein